MQITQGRNSSPKLRLIETKFYLVKINIFSKTPFNGEGKNRLLNPRIY